MILLIIEDDQVFAELVSIALNAREVMVAGTMRQGFAMMELQRPNFIVLDLSLPDSSARDTLSRIPELKARSNGAIITVVTGSDRPDLEARARQSGADHFIHKDPGSELVRKLASKYTKDRPCLSRDTVEELEKRVVQMTAQDEPVSAPRVCEEALKKVPPLLKSE